ncbi:lipoprotein insertase outer membrane protein LolB [Methyloversatilis sp.]|uniref:lipoprotein insertase outer membrane protein LolB n=1 Tax=Methyloversatilis sp. TaxID=2569862 RepID=UPI0027BA107D|nr:lipoprotein insertase outer membrane protein LolB [Methyloversatilis sp.]
MALVAACAATLSACATRPPVSLDEHGLIRSMARDERAAAFSLSGRFVVKGPDQSASASLDWQHAQDRDELQINGPLGKVLAQLTRDASGVRLVDDGQRVTRAATLDELARAAFGADIPLTGAAYWVTGRPGGASVTSRDGTGRIAALTERGWRVEFVRYEDDSADALPRLIEASDGEHSFRLLIDEWSPVK